MPPASGDGEVVARHVAPPDGTWDGNSSDLRTQGRSGNTGDRRFWIEQSRELAPMYRRPGERLSYSLSLAVRPAGQRDARPFHAQCSAIELAVGRIVQGGENMMEQIFDAKAEESEIALRRDR